MSQATNPDRIFGTAPWLPEPLASMTWWTAPVRAERLAALRIGMGLALLLDVLVYYWPRANDFFGAGSLGSAEVFAARLGHGTWRWSLLSGLGDGDWFAALLVVWGIAAVFLAVGCFSRTSALVAWALAISVHNQNFYIHNSGDLVKQIALFYLVVAPAGAVWSLDNWWRKRQAGPREEAARPAFIHPWSLRLLMVQLATIYFVNGVYKLAGGDWRSGEVMHYVLGNVAWTRFAFGQLPLPDFTIPLMTYVTLIWELGFPLLVCIKPLRTPTLWLGVLFHLGTAALLQLGMFPVYMLCLYLPLVPWERICGGAGSVAHVCGTGSASASTALADQPRRMTFAD